MIRLFLILSLIFISVAEAKNPYKYGYVRSDYVDEEVWNIMEPYFLPEDHPIKERLDKIFSSSRATADHHSLKKAGFSYVEAQGQHVVTLTHSKMKNYVFKVYLDCEPMEEEDWKEWLLRLEGAEIIREAIVRNGCHWIFKVPRKWVYPLPEKPYDPYNSESFRKNFILIAEDMQILKSKDNHSKYRKLDDTRVLDALYAVIHEAGLDQCIRISNIPWCEDGKIAFIDTKSFHNKVRFDPLDEFLSKKMRKHWDKIIETRS